mmetsp:Transcript_22065/g.70466  ORF Transcript_22065/g.70466 Transcript_22065/m.70466 type:complete len:400 (+) Transcript_22065:185-1384(+)
MSRQAFRRTHSLNHLYRCRDRSRPHIPPHLCKQPPVICPMADLLELPCSLELGIVLGDLRVLLEVLGHLCQRLRVEIHCCDRVVETVRRCHDALTFKLGRERAKVRRLVVRADGHRGGLEDDHRGAVLGGAREHETTNGFVLLLGRGRRGSRSLARKERFTICKWQHCLAPIYDGLVRRERTFNVTVIERLKGANAIQERLRHKDCGQRIKKAISAACKIWALADHRGKRLLAAMSVVVGVDHHAVHKHAKIVLRRGNERVERGTNALGLVREQVHRGVARERVELPLGKLELLVHHEAVDAFFHLVRDERTSRGDEAPLELELEANRRPGAARQRRVVSHEQGRLEGCVQRVDPALLRPRRLDNLGELVHEAWCKRHLVRLLDVATADYGHDHLVCES